MSARTTWYVDAWVADVREERIEVSAVTSEEAIEEALRNRRVVQIINVKHWTEVEDERG